MKNTGNENDKDIRRIKQVYVSDAGDETETVIGTRHAPERKEPRVAEPKRMPGTGPVNFMMTEQEMHGNEHKRSTGTHVIRGIAIAFAMIFSLVLAMAVGAGLALWDSNRTVAEFREILLGREVAAATSAAEDVHNADSGKDPEDGKNDAVADDGDDKDTGEEQEDETEEPDTEDGSEEDVSEDEDESEDEEDEEDEDASEESLDAEAQWDEPSGYGYTLVSDEEGSDNVEKAGSDDEIEKEEEDETIDADPTEDYPLPFSKVDESYFTDALFIGDSRLQGFGFWSGLPATYYCATGFQLYKYDTTNVVQTENGKVPIFEAMPYDAFTKIYIKVGLNELGYGTEENFEKYYSQLIAQLREYEPRAIIYVHGLLPVTAEKSASDKAHNNPNINTRNAALKKFAEREKAYYLDAGPVLSDEDGNLRPEMTTDGIHLSAQYMKIWREYLCEHAVVIE